ncbi:MAG: hypothetical protein M0R03_20380 [Novosphingobium sp.]|nr:hypothetical protein [Novosphingobium sp.]
MLTLLIFTGICFGFSNQFKYSQGPAQLFDKIKVIGYKISPNLYNGMECLMCFPTWVGMGLSILSLFVFSLPLTPLTLFFQNSIIDLSITEKIIHYILIILFDGFISSGLTYLINTIQLYFEKNTPIEIEE